MGARVGEWVRVCGGEWIRGEWGWAGRLGLCPVGLASWATDGPVGGSFFCICLFSVFISFLLLF